MGKQDDVDELAGPQAALPSEPLAERIASRLAAELGRRMAEPPAPGLHLVATPIGNLGDITLRALAVLATADTVCCEDTRHTRHLLAHFGIERHVRAYHEHNAEAERPRLLSLLAEGRAVALVSDAGMPLVSDPGFKLVRSALEAGYAVTVVPGPSAVLAGLALSGLPTDEFHFAGFLPAREGQRRARLAELGAVPGTLLLFEAPTRLAESLADVAATLGPDRPVAVLRELTKRFEESRRGTAAELAAWAAGASPRGELVIAIGAAQRSAATDVEIDLALAALPAETSLKEASKAVAQRFGVARSRVYEIGLRRKGRHA